MTATLHIEHPVSDLGTWATAFGRFADLRTASGVRGQRVAHPSGDEAYVVVDLEFGTVEEAEAFREILRTRIWASPESSPALAGEPRAVVLEPVELVGSSAGAATSKG